MQAIDAIYQQYAPAVFRFAYGLCGDAHLANDLVAETFVRAMLSSKPIGMETLRAYLCTIARRLYLKKWHRHRTLSPFTFTYANGHLRYFMLRDAPAMALIYAAVAAMAWIGIVVLHRRINTA